ncbi:dienelactone hydrolase family protein [Paracoccus sediminicola]|uniref:dienelactone hydrolase family protein n=1 Tax=Paracoccus sediminicola TaxID=3017783 RepID=UPI0022F07FF2|nr:dienelactone hydrolase family protein [Paracoccus sediminicola]WBU56111.1 dienelactone hydrolase family protein [Paracoccus sediminicola]
MKRRWYWLVAGLFVLAMAVLGANTVRHRLGLVVYQHTPAEQRARLAEYWRMVPPETPLSEAGAIVLSGCDGVRDNMDFWAGFLSDREHDALILDSHSPRGLDDFETWRLLCVGQVLPGAQRAGDLAVALAETSRDDMLLLGASHGGWTVLEFLRQALTEELPPGLSEWPAAPQQLLARVGAAVVLYPYCGALNGAAEGDWSMMPPVLMVIAAEDELGLTEDCVAMAEALQDRGATVETPVYEGAGHGFDQKERAAFSVLEYRPDLRARAAADVAGFLERHGL